MGSFFFLHAPSVFLLILCSFSALFFHAAPSGNRGLGACFPEGALCPFWPFTACYVVLQPFWRLLKGTYSPFLHLCAVCAPLSICTILGSFVLWRSSRERLSSIWSIYAPFAPFVSFCPLWPFPWPSAFSKGRRPSLLIICALLSTYALFCSCMAVRPFRQGRRPCRARRAPS